MLVLSTRFSQALKNGKFWVLVMMLIGSVLVIVYKFQNSAYVYEGPMFKQNFHPFMQSASMFLGQMISLPIYFLFRKRNQQKYKQKQRKALQEGKILEINKFYLMIPAFFDLLTSTMQFVAFNFISGSAYQMMKGGSIVTTFIFSITFLKKPIQRKHLFGSLLAFIGILIVGIANSVFTSQGPTSPQNNTFLQIMGYILMVASLFSNGFFFVFQQKLLDTYHIEPLQIVGFQGLFGFLMYAMLIPILCHIPCHFGPSACVYSYQGFTYMEGWTVYFQQLVQNPHLLILGFVTIFGILVFNVAGVTVTKYINALARAIANMTKSIIVWIIGLIITLIYGPTYPNLRWQKIQANIIILQTVGFIFMVLGNFVYNAIIKLPKRLQNQSNQLASLQNSQSEELINEQEKQQ